MTIPTIDRELHTFSFWSKSAAMTFALNLIFVLVAIVWSGIEAVNYDHFLFANHLAFHLNYFIALDIGLVILLAAKIRSAKIRSNTFISIKGDTFRYGRGIESKTVVESLRNVETLTIRIKGGAIGIASWRRIDFKGGQSIIFDGQVERVEELEDLLTERSGKQFLRWLTGEAYQKPKV